MVDYFVKKNPDGEVQGPYAEEQIQSMAEAGQLEPTGMLSRDKKRWFEAGLHSGLHFPQSPNQANSKGPTGKQALRRRGPSTGPSRTAGDHPLSPTSDILHADEVLRVLAWINLIVATVGSLIIGEEMSTMEVPYEYIPGTHTQANPWGIALALSCFWLGLLWSVLLLTVAQIARNLRHEAREGMPMESGNAS